MFANYLAAALRNLVRNKLYAAINILGLTIGFAAALLMALFVRDELTYDTWVPGYENVYRVVLNSHPPGAPPLHTIAPGYSVPVMLRQDVPQVQAVSVLVPETRGVRRGEIESNETVIWADPEIFDVLPFPTIAGDLKSALRDPNSVVITRNAAHKFFGHESVVGEILEIDRRHPMRVAAVLQNPPSRSHLDIHIFASSRASFSPTANVPCCTIAISNGFTYARLEPGARRAVEQSLPGVLDHYIPSDSYGLKGGTMKASEVYALELQPLSAIHMISQKGGVAVSHLGMLRPPGDKAVASALGITSALVVLVAVANFVNLMTARASRRAVEVGVRKASGGSRGNLIKQFLFESFFYVGISLIMAMALARIMLPGFNGFLGRDLALDYTEPVIVASVLATFAVTGILGGLYPALVLSNFRPAAVLKANWWGLSDPAGLRRVLVIAQFAVLIILIVATAVIGRQTAYVTGNHFRLDTDQLLFIASPCPERFRDTLAAIPGVKGVSCAGTGFLGGVEAVGLTTLPNGARFNLSYFGVEPGLLELYGLTPLAGRFLSADRAGDLEVSAKGPRPVVINESAVRSFQFDSPAAAIGHSQSDRGLEIVGVVPDFPVRSLRDPIGPSAFRTGRGYYAYLVAKLESGDVGETLKAIDTAWEKLGTGRPIARQFYDQHVQAQYVDIVRQTQAFTAFSVVSVFIACLGLFGLSAFSAEQRTKEIGIRKAMGAKTGDVLGLLVWQFTKPVLWANVIAWPVAYLAMRRWLEGFAYHIDLEPWTFLAASGAALAIAVVTVAGHAWFVARTQPVHALRYE